MRRFAFIAAVLLGTSTLAVAEPWWGHDHDRDRHGDYDRRTDDRRTDEGYRRQSRDMVELAQLPLDYKARADLNPQMGRFSRLRIQGVNGRPMLSSIAVRYANGQLAEIPIGRRLRHGEVVDVDLGGRRAIAAIAVHGQPDGHSEIAVFGLP